MNNIICGDSLIELKKMPDESVDCCITSPPYWGLRDYGTAKWEGGDPKCEHLQRTNKQGNKTQPCFENTKFQYLNVCLKCGAKRIDAQLGLEKTPEEYVSKMVEVFREVKRVLKKEGTCWLNLGDSYNGGGRGGIGCENASLKQFTNTGTLTMPKLIKDEKLKPKDLVGIPWLTAFALRADGWYLRQDIIWHKPNPMPESVTDRCTKSHEYIFLLAKSPKYYFDNEAIREPVKIESQKELGGIGNYKEGKRTNNNYKQYKEIKGANRRSVWTITTKPFKEAHFATFPEDLITPMVLAGCPKEVCNKCGKAREKILDKKRIDPRTGNKVSGGWGDGANPENQHKGGFNSIRPETITEIMGQTDCGCNAGFSAGIVLDPFIGAGTTGVVAKKLGRNYLGIELNQKYVSMAEERIRGITEPFL